LASLPAYDTPERDAFAACFESAEAPRTRAKFAGLLL
jgi:hypothetical protein